MRRGDAPRYAYANTNTPPRLTGSSGVASPGQQDANLPTLKMFRTRKIAEANGCLFPDVRKEPKSERYRQKCLREARRQATVNLVSLQHAGHRQTSCPEMDETPSHWQPALPVLRTSADFMPMCRRSGAAVQGRPFPFHRHCRKSGLGNVADGTASAFNYVEIATRGTNQQSLFLTAPGCWPSRPYRRLPLTASSSSRAGARTTEREAAF
jgi:hypothetical protein